MSVTIRAATPDDAPEVFRLIHELAVYEKLADSVKSTPDSIRAAMESDDPRVHVLLAYDDTQPGKADNDAASRDDAGRAVGFALYFLTFSTFEGRPTLYLEDLFVEPARRGSGVGTAFLRELARTASDRGCARMEWTALDWNTTARTFYENLGADPKTDWIIHRLGEEGIAALAAAGV